jgi:hypothetical protein
LRRALPIAALALALVSGIAGDARAHPLGFAVVSIRETTVHEADVVVRVSGTESDPGRIALTWAEGCTERVSRDVMLDEVRERRSRVTCERALAATTVHVEGPARGLEVLFEITLVSGASSRRVVRALPSDVTLGTSESTTALALAQARLGALHFALGIDHVLFVVGAYFLARERGARAVAIAVTSFTVGHALTLAWASFGGAAIPTRPVEACIALSLVHVARELRVEADTLTRTRPAIACGLFGLVHGAGLASAMTSAGLSGTGLFTSVVSFNLGLELAELALVLTLLGVVRGRALLVAQRATPWIIGAVGAWLLLDRLA